MHKISSSEHGCSDNSDAAALRDDDEIVPLDLGKSLVYGPAALKRQSSQSYSSDKFSKCSRFFQD